jgi:hypothetical protein
VTAPAGIEKSRLAAGVLSSPLVTTIRDRITV